MFVHRVNLALQPVDLRLDDAQGHLRRREIRARGGEIGTEIEQFVLDGANHRGLCVVVDVEGGDAERAVGFVDIADRLRAGVGF
jgi:hypothetical protein